MTTESYDPEYAANRARPIAIAASEAGYGDKIDDSGRLDDTTISDLICDLLHLADGTEDASAVQCLNSAITNYTTMLRYFDHEELRIDMINALVRLAEAASDPNWAHP